MAKIGKIRWCEDRRPSIIADLKLLWELQFLQPVGWHKKIDTGIVDTFYLVNISCIRFLSMHHTLKTYNQIFKAISSLPRARYHVARLIFSSYN